jgi:hypothetical protein
MLEHSIQPLRIIIMGRRWQIVLGLALLVVLAGVFFHPAIYWPVTGWVRGAAFYDGRPTSYWSHAIRRWASDSAALSWMDKVRVGIGFPRSEAVPRPAVVGEDPDPRILSWFPLNRLDLRPTRVDPAAMPVLAALLRDENDAVRIQAALALMGLATDGTISEAEARALVGEELLSMLERPFNYR